MSQCIDVILTSKVCILLSVDFFRNRMQVKNAFANIKMSHVLSLAEVSYPKLPPSEFLNSWEMSTSSSVSTSGNDHHRWMSLNRNQSINRISINRTFILSETSTSSSGNSRSHQEGNDGKRPPSPPSDDQHCLRLLSKSGNSSRISTSSPFEKFSRRCMEKERMTTKLSRCHAKKWWQTGSKCVKRSLICSQCKRMFHKDFGLRTHRCHGSSIGAPNKRFQCEICQARLKMQSVKGHIKNKHQLEMKEYSALYHRKLFNCEICDDAVDMNRASIVGHLKKIHFLSLKDYCAFYGKLHDRKSLEVWRKR